MDKFQTITLREEITDRLRSLLDGYKDGLSIFKEMIQNADDAKASTVKICYDLNAQKPLFDPDSPHKQGHALYFYNDSKFEDHDFKNISLLGAGTKSNSPEKIGKFGLGFTSVYNITDNPSVISRNKFIIFDPAVDKLKSPGIQFDFDDPEFDSVAKAFLPFNGIFDCEISKGYSFPGTLIRLPFRKTPSKISDIIYTPESASSLFEIFFSNADKLLLFTQSVKSIEFHVLAEGSSVMERVYRLEVSVERVLKSHGVGLSCCGKNDKQLSTLQAESSLLRAAVENGNNPKVKSLDNAMIVTCKTFVEHSSVQYKRLFQQPFSASHRPETHWLIVSSYSRANLKTGTHFTKFIPCVGMALSVEKDREGWRLCTDLSPHNFNGSIFCFLPLSINSRFRFHVNSTFMLTEDRTRIFERSSEDSTACYKHEWNEYLVVPIVENLFAMLAKASEHLRIESTVAAVEWLFPTGSDEGYFRNIETRFYNRVCSPIGDDRAFPAEDSKGCMQLHAFKDCLFVDFDVGDTQLQQKAVKFVTQIYRKSSPPKNIIQLPLIYLTKIKNLASDQTKFLTDLTLLEHLIKHRASIPTVDYQNLIIYFLRTKCINVESAYATLIKISQSILTSNKSFKIPSQLIDKRSNQLFTSLYENVDDRFLNDDYYISDVVMFALRHMGLIANKLPDEFVLEIAKRVQQLRHNPDKAKKLSENLLKYFQLNPISTALSSQLLNIEWVFCKSRPLNWTLKWAGNDQKLVRPVDLLSDSFEAHAGCVEPVLEHAYCELLGVKTWDSLKLIKSAIRQLEYLGSITGSEQSVQIDQMFNSFVELLKMNPVGVEVFKLLPRNWVYCWENGNARFLDMDSLAMKVENPVFPELFMLPWIYQNDDASKKFFKSAGIADVFSIDSLKDKLCQLQREHGTKPITDGHFRKVCFNILSEMISVGDPEQLRNLKKDEDFYMPDTEYVFRKARHFCTKLTGQDANTEMYVLHESILQISSHFGIEDSRKMISQAIGEPFGQREELSNRIKQILKAYDTRSHVFTEMVQNADDAGASEISFVVDWRQLDTKNVFGECFEPLQGPALCCWNNAVFTEDDYKGIISLGHGSKRTDLKKIGRFGVGINTQFHITDAIQFISNEDKYVILDPLCKHYPKLDSNNPGRKIDVKQLNGIYSDVLSGFNLGTNSMPLKGSTMFRFSLRSSKPTDSVNFLSTQIINAVEMQQMMVKFAETAYETLFFLKNIRKISFYKLDANNNIQLLHSHQASLENDSDKTRLTNFWNEFNQRTKKDFKLRQIICQKISLNLSILSSTMNEANVSRSYQVHQQFGFESLDYSNNKEKIDSLEINKPDKFYPLAGIAYEPNLDPKTSYKLYSFLPLHQDSPIGCHINGYFALHHENRTQLFEGTNTNLIDQNTAKWCIEWNKALIERIILPLYINTIEDRLSQERGDSEKLIKHFYNMFPTNRSKSEKLKDYFKFMTKEFYRKVFDEEIKCIPVYCPQESNVKIFKPSQLLFSTELTKKLNAIFNQDNKKVNEICDIVSHVVKDYCSYDRVVTLFKVYGEIDLKQLNTESFVKDLKTFGLRLEGVDIDQSILKNIKNAFVLLKLCLEDCQDLKILDELPLLITSDNIVRKFSTKNPVFRLPSKFIGHFEKSGLKFLHPGLLEIPKLIDKSQTFIKKITISDLNFVCQMYFDKKLQPDMGYDAYPEPEADIKELLELIWTFIIEEQEEHKDISRSQQIEQLVSIRDWPLIPVTLPTGCVKLAPLSHIEKIINESTGYYKLKKLLHRFPVTKSKFFGVSFQNTFGEFINRLAMDPSNRPPDFVILLSSMATPSLISTDSEIICVTLNNSINMPYDRFAKKHITSLLMKDEKLNLRTDNQLKGIIKELPIFQRYMSSTELVRLSNKSAYAVKSNLKEFITDDIFENYLQINSLVLIKSTFTCLNSYLAIEEISQVRVCKDFFVWSLNQQTQNAQTCKRLMTLLKDEFAYDRKEFDREELVNLLVQVSFITIDCQDFKPNELYDRNNYLFIAGFPDRILPEEYYKDHKWFSFIVFLELNVTPSDKNILKLASIFTKQFESQLIDAKELKNLSSLLIKQLNTNKKSAKFDPEILSQLKSVKFLPSYFLTAPTSIHLKIFNPIGPKNQGGNVCLKGAFSKDYIDFVWTTNAILPDFFEWKTDPDYKQNVTEPSCSIIVTNFINLCTSSRSLNLDEKETNELEALFVRYYKELERLLETSNNREEIIRLKDIACIWNIQYRHMSLNKPACFYKSIGKEESVPPYILELPSIFSKFPKLMETLAFPDRVTFTACTEALGNFSEFKNTKLNDIQMDNFMSLYKFFLYDDLLSENLPVVEFLCPNSDGVLRRLQDLYYDSDDPEHFSYLRKHAPDSVQNLMFDIDLVQKKYLITTGRIKQDDSSLKKTAMFNELNSWERIFGRIPYFVKNIALAPRPLFDLIECRINEVDDKTTDVDQLGPKLNTLLKSSSFLDSIVRECDSRLGSSVIEPELSSRLKAALDSLTVVIKQELTTCYYNRKTKNRIEIKKQEIDHLVTKPRMNEKRVILSKVLSLHNCVYYLTEIVFREVQEIMRSVPIAITGSSQLYLKCKINEYLQSMSA